MQFTSILEWPPKTKKNAMRQNSQPSDLVRSRAIPHKTTAPGPAGLRFRLSSADAQYRVLFKLCRAETRHQPESFFQEDPFERRLLISVNVLPTPSADDIVVCRKFTSHSVLGLGPYGSCCPARLFWVSHNLYSLWYDTESIFINTEASESGPTTYWAFLVASRIGEMFKCGVLSELPKHHDERQQHVLTVNKHIRQRRSCVHRGPDQSGYALLHNKTIGFGHNRLSIQDPGAPPQPLLDTSSGTALIFNGEVYDHLELGHNLTSHHNATLSDATNTSVTLTLLNGEFAFVIWDAKRQQVVAVRDRFGIKPLYWYYDSNRLVFSSEIKAILSLQGVERKFSTAEWLDHLEPTLGHSQHLTFIEGIYNVLPGQYATMDMSSSDWKKPQFTTYWTPLPLLQSPDTLISYADAKAEVRRLLTEAVKRRLVADRELCVYLSGGVDSTVICGIVRELGHPLTCITIGFDDHVVSEESLAAKTAQYYSLPHECVTFTLADTAKYVERTLYHTEIPANNPHAVAKFRLSEFAQKKGFVVALTGEGSDELMLGYPSFRAELLLELRSKGGTIAERAERLRVDVFNKEPLNAGASNIWPDEIPWVRKVPCWQGWYLVNAKTKFDALRAPYADGHSLPSRTLDDYCPAAPEGLSGLRITQVDWLGRLHNYVIPCLGERVEMAPSMEGRPPMLDKTFSEFVLSLPQEYLIDPETLREKRVLYEAF
ncbi:adenine nucleotide alpha hydrolases-like protein [Ramaria rubella]|nr:adenine nucleotide alpha hydrolases-like protein [Ramaria rubella]